MWIEAYRHDALTPIFEALSFIGDATFFLAVFTVGYWVFNRAVFARVTLLLLGTALANNLLKAMFAIPRPDASLALVTAHGWSFPSGHSMISAAIWPWLALEYQEAGGRRWALPAAWLLALGVASSRVYLGVHTVRDVVWGLFLGALILGIARHWHDTSPPAFWTRLSRGAKFAYLTILVLPAVFLPRIHDHDTTAAIAGGALLTLVLGLDWTRRNASRLPKGIGRMVLAAVIGLVGTFGLRVALKELMLAGGMPEVPLDFVRYGLIGLWISAGAPWVFKLLKLVDTEPMSEVPDPRTIGSAPGSS